ncbi:LysR family transcriptional regulator [uncultured Vibrio sp.]|uniref:LysR family transcriptional regulator n=1 Tax=uncultured Vibrio sp. TaxID=114054 RepID=UPI0025F525F9|nr:LysR family transcriptional regulator [uncultured Vibrio sp.]
MYDDIALFIHIVEARGLAGAAKQLNIPPATVTRRLKKLEQQLGCQLIHRSARQFELTSDGSVYFESFSSLINEFDSISSELSSETKSRQGELIVLAPTNISIGYLQPMWSQFIAQYPEIQLNLKLNNDNKDIVEERADIALRIGPQRDSELYQIGVGSIPTYLVASPHYLQRSAPLETLSDIEQHQRIAVTHLNAWPLTHVVSNKEVIINQKASLKVDDINVASQFAKDGHGLALLPATEVLKYLDSGELVMPLPQWQGPERELYLIWPSGKLLGAKARCLKDYIQMYLLDALSGLGRI